MQKLVLSLTILLGLAACSQQQPVANQMPLDMQTVAEYNAKVASGKTAQKQPQQEVATPLNQSDYQQKTQTSQSIQPRVVLVPSFGYYHGW